MTDETRADESSASHLPITGPRYGRVDTDYGMRLATAPDGDGPIWMLNLMHYRERADYADGRTSDISGREADDRYTPLGPLAEVGAEIVFVADVELQFLNDEPAWDRVAIVKYPTRASFIRMQTLPEFQELHHHKDAGMAQTFVIGCVPMTEQPLAGADLPDWADVAHPPTDDDPPRMVLHLIRYEQPPAPGESPADMVEYTAHASTIAVPHGARVAGWFDVEGTIVGDGRAWHQARFNAFPSAAAILAVFTDRQRLEVQREHREVAIADTYTLVMRPSIDRIAESIA